MKYVTILKKVSELKNNLMSEMKQIRKTFLSGKLSATLVIPIEVARRYGLEKPSHVVVEEIADGILIRKLRFGDEENNVY